MKFSKYNITSDAVNGKKVLFNTFNGKMVALPESTLKVLSGGDISLIQDSAAGDFIRQNFFVGDSVDEGKSLADKLEAMRICKDLVSLTILTTMDCNLKCRYCYQEGIKNDNYMTEATADKTAQFLEKLVEKNKPSKIRLHFYGGEPLMNFKVIENIVPRANALAKKHGANFGVYATTNGVLLTKIMAERLKALGFSYLQITVDGPERIHDSRRPTVNNKGSFKVIMDNITNAADKIRINLRINVDKQNIDTIDELLQDIVKRGLKNKVVINLELLGPAFTEIEHCSKYMFADDAEKSLMGPLYEKIARHGLSTFGIMPVEGACEHYAINSLAVAPDGGIFMCQGFAGYDKYRIGNINNDEAIDPEKLSGFMKHSPWKDCLDCPYAPICRGGCRAFVVALKNDITKPDCKRSFFDKVYPVFLKTKYLKAVDSL